MKRKLFFVNIMQPVAIWGLAAFCAFLPGSLWGQGWATNDWQFLESIEQANLRFFLNEKTGPYDLLYDFADYTGGSFASATSVAGIGFELTALCLGHYRGWISYSNAYEQILTQMKAFDGQLSADPEVLKRENGWTYHWYNLQTGYEQSPDGLSLLDHSLFIAGCIFASEYFKGTEAGELGTKLYEETTWSWRPNSDYDFGYSENLLAVVESAEAPAFKKGIEAKNMWNSYVVPWPRKLQLYFWQYPHCWVDFRFRSDENGYNHADVARDSILYQRQQAIDLHNSDPGRYTMLSSNVWGWTAASPSTGYRQMAPWPLWLDRYYSTEEATDNGSITPFALPPCMIYAPTETMAAMKHLYEEYYINGWNPDAGEIPIWSDMYGFLNCFNTGQPWNSGRSNWYWGVNAAIDYGPNVLMLENYKMGTTWRFFMQNSSIADGMTTIGFCDSWNVSSADFSNQVNAFGGGLGHWDNAPSTSSIAYVSVSNYNDEVGNDAVRITSSGSRAGGWIELNGSDQRGQAQLNFWCRIGNGDERIAVGLKDTAPGIENKLQVQDYCDVEDMTNWTEVSIPLEDFCMTGQVTNDVWLGSLSLVSFEFTNSTGGSIDIDSLAFTADTIKPALPAGFGVAQAGPYARVCWNPDQAERDVVGYHIWRRYSSTSGFERVTDYLVPAYLGVYEDTTCVVRADQEVRYAIQAFDNAESVNWSSFTSEKKAVGGKLDIDWNNGANPNVLGGRYDSYWGTVSTQILAFVYTNLPNGSDGWCRFSEIQGTLAGHFLDMNDQSVADYQALSFYIRGTNGGEQLLIGMKDDSETELKWDLDDYLENGAIETNWTRAVIPLSDFTNIDFQALRNISFTYEDPGAVYLADLSFLMGERSLLVNSYATECENWTHQYGSTTQDYKAGASAGEVLGWGWGLNNSDYADYNFYMDRVLSNPVMRLRYACGTGNGRSLDVRWDDVYLGTLACTNTGGWGDYSNEFSHAYFGMPLCATGYHKLTFYCNGDDDPVNMDCWRFETAGEYFRECEQYSVQVGTTTQDLKAGASAGQVLGQGWGTSSNDYVEFDAVDAGMQTGAWLYLWYALGSAAGREIDVKLDDQWQARLACPPTAGWGDHAGDFDHATAFMGPLDAGPHTLRFTPVGDGAAINLDCFYIGFAVPDLYARDTDGDGLSDRRELTLGTSIYTNDTDGDGLSDADELIAAAWGQVTDPALADPDGDGLDDYGEDIAGTDAWDPASCFEFQRAEMASPSVIELRWPTVTGRQYRLFYADGTYSNTTVFQQIPDPGAIQYGPTNAAYQDTNGLPSRTYRIDVSLP